MAKGKHATALFEVIHSGKNSQKSLLSTPRWWFKKRDQDAAAAAASAATAAAKARGQRHAPVSTAAPVSNVTSSTEAGESSESLADPTIGRDPTLGRELGARPAQREDSSTSDVKIGYSSSSAPRPGRLDVAVDPDRQQITFKVSYTSAIIVTFSVVVAVALAYLVGQKMNRGPAQALAGQSSEQLRAGPKNSGVMDVGTRNPGVVPPAVQREPDPAITSRGSETNPDNVEAPTTLGNAGAVVESSTPQPRVLNLNYVVVQSYPDQKGAEEARDALVKAGINCTIEQKLRGLNPNWFTVVGTQGFQRASGTEFDNYIRKIDGVSQQFAQRKRSFKAFQPLAYKWTHAG
ncbi:MAG: hypothetical protein H7Z14_00420 [Anaerolineae bacterium]|nr:hypothetical protein [Phycisphaerae bacterium]